jgi:hypothetical protein
MAKNGNIKRQEPPLGIYLIYLFMVIWPILAITPLMIPIVSALREILDVANSQLNYGDYQTPLIVSSATLATAALVFFPFLIFYKRMCHNFFHPRLVSPAGGEISNQSEAMTAEPEEQTA